jgi:glycosyltransferase involved in cell wall biosynthesis
LSKERGTSLTDGVRVVHLTFAASGTRWRHAFVYRQIAAVLDATRPRLVHMQTATGTLGLATGLAAKQRGIPSLVKYTADLADERLDRRRASEDGRDAASAMFAKARLLDAWQRALFSLYDRVWATTPAFADAAHVRFGVPEGKIRVLPNFVDLAPLERVAQLRSQRRAGGATVLTVARMTPIKGIDVCIRAMARLRDLGATLRIAGTGSNRYRRSLEQLAERLDVQGSVEFLGAVHPDDMPEQYRRATIFALASRYEAFGISVVEAMAAGLPIVASAVGGMRGLLAGGGLLIPPEDDVQLAAAVRRLCRDPVEQRELVAVAQRRARDFSLDRGVDRLVDVYAELAPDVGEP